jgi:conjugal transfer pilus assembly protein TraV
VVNPLRAAPRILRLWIKPWEDADHDLNGESLVYVQVDSGRWMVEHAQRLARQPFAPVKPVRPSAEAAREDASAEKKSSRAPLPAHPTANQVTSTRDALRDLRTRVVPSSDD